MNPSIENSVQVHFGNTFTTVSAVGKGGEILGQKRLVSGCHDVVDYFVKELQTKYDQSLTKPF